MFHSRQLVSPNLKWHIKFYNKHNNNYNNDNASISIVLDNLSSVVPMARQTNVFLVSRQKSAKLEKHCKETDAAWRAEHNYTQHIHAKCRHSTHLLGLLTVFKPKPKLQFSATTDTKLKPQFFVGLDTVLSYRVIWPSTTSMRFFYQPNDHRLSEVLHSTH